MAITALPPRSVLFESTDTRDPLLQRIADSNTFECDWPTLRQHLLEVLLSTLQTYQALGPPLPPSNHHSPPAPPLNASLPSSAINDAPPPTSLLLSPSQPTTLPPTPGSTEVHPPSSPITPFRDDITPSTTGGLIIPPFPPLDPNRRKKSISIPDRPIITMKVNGLTRSLPAPVSSAAMGAFEDEWDEDVVIGGKKLPGWMGMEDGRKEVERVGKIIGNLDAPPFTIQRIAELLLTPTRYHKSLGKYLRALEKSLLVNTEYQPPSYDPSPFDTIPLFSRPRSTSSASSSTTASHESLPMDSNTPMFSPIPFLAARMDGTAMSGGDDMMEGAETSNRMASEGLMSPLMLGEGSSKNGDFTFAQAPTVRSPTPEPEDLPTSPIPEEPPTSPISPGDSPAYDSDPGHQPYLGRVDELDTGPLPTTPTSLGNVEGEGSGEGGNMTPHGMSERPIPLSSTTTPGGVSGEEARRIATIPRTPRTRAEVGNLGDRFTASHESDDEAEKKDVN